MTVVIGIAALLAIAVLMNFFYGRLPKQPPAGGDYLRVGIQDLHYLESPGAEPAIVFIHGMPGLARDFDAVRALLPGRRTIAIDRPGYGWSKGGPLEFAGQVAAVAAAMQQLGTGRAIVAGHSFGGVIALGLAQTEPQLVEKLLLLAPASGGTRLSKQRMRVARAMQILELPVIRQLCDIFFLRALRRTASRKGGHSAYGRGPENA